MAQRKMPLPKGAMKNVTIRFTADEIEWLNATAKKQFRPVAGLVRYVLAQYRKREAVNSECPQPLLPGDGQEAPDTHHS